MAYEMRLIDANLLVDKLYDNEFAMLCPLDEVCGVIDDCPTVEVAQEAMERQVHKPVEVVDEPGREFLDYLCPHCKVTLQQKRKGAKNDTVYKYKHCHECGQGLIWDLQ